MGAHNCIPTAATATKGRQCQQKRNSAQAAQAANRNGLIIEQLTAWYGETVPLLPYP